MPEPLLIANGVICPDGTLAGPQASGEVIIPGDYEVLMAFDSFYEAKPDQPAFLRAVPFRFHIATTDEHVHLPIKLSPWGYALFRGF